MGDSEGIFELAKTKVSAIISKPKMTDKLLNKPPFRFLHDTISAIINTTGFAEGLYTPEEKDSANVNDREAKIAYLQKIITCVGICQGVQLEVKPAKVVAGQEAELTCKFLIALADCSSNASVDTETAVHRTLAGEVAGSGPPALKSTSSSSGSKGEPAQSKGYEDNSAAAAPGPGVAEAKGSSSSNASGPTSAAGDKDSDNAAAAPVLPERGMSRGGNRGSGRAAMPTAENAGLEAPPAVAHLNLDSELDRCDGSEAATQALLGAVITKPRLTEKLLGKPPFRFLHDIIMEVMRVTGFGTNLFAPEECESSKVTDKEQKLAFLEKIIRLVGVQLQTNLMDVKPIKVIAGLEANSTNRFLQLLAVAATHCPDSTNSVRVVLDQLGGTGERSAPSVTPEPAAAAKSVAPAIAEEKGSSRPSQHQQQQQQDPISPAPSNNNYNAASSSNKEDMGSAGTGDDGDAAPKRISMRPTSALRRPPPVKERARQADNNITSLSSTNATTHATSGVAGAGTGNERRRADGLIMDGADDDEIDEDEDLLDGDQRDAKRLGAPDLAIVGVSSPNATINNAAESKIVQDIRTRQAEQDALARGAATVIADDKDDALDGTAGSGDGAKGGGIRLGRLKKTGADKKGSSGGSSGGGSAPSSAGASGSGSTDIDKLRSVVQLLVKYTGPLGSCMDFIQEDIGLMSNELKKWEEDCRRYETQLEVEKKKSETMLKPYQNELNELDEQIKDEIAKISSMKAGIVRNEGKIQTILKTIVSA